MRVYVVRKNADFTEGRGPMLLDKIFLHGEHAVRYVAAQYGIFGSKQSVEMGKYGHYAYANGYQIDSVEVYEDDVQAVEEMEAAEREKALKKLTTRERQLLGIK